MRAGPLDRVALALALIVVCLGCIGLLSSCAPNPRDQANADAIMERAEQDAANQRAAREQKQAEFDLKLSEDQATSAERVAGLNRFIAFLSYGASAAAFLTMLGAGEGLREALVGFGKAIATAAKNKAEIVPMDPQTMAFPLIPVYEGGRKLAMHNPNDGSVIMFDLANPADQQKIAGLIAQNIAIGVANKARQHKTDPTGVAMVGTNPLLVGIRKQTGSETFEVGEIISGRNRDAEYADVDSGGGYDNAD
jgi:hypothetical protein